MLTKDRIKPAVILLYTVTASFVWYYFCKYIDAFPSVQTDFWLGTLPLISAAVFFGLIPAAIIRFGFQEHLADYGLKIGIARRTLRTFLIAAPIVVFIAVCTGHNAAFYDTYPLNAALRHKNGGEIPPNVGVFIVHSLFYIGYYAGWEFLFRGFIQHGLTKCCGLLTAILVQTLASTMLHYGHPPSEVFGSIIAGVVWGILAYRTQSILSGFLQHSLLGIVLDGTLIFG